MKTLSKVRLRFSLLACVLLLSFLITACGNGSKEFKSSDRITSTPLATFCDRTYSGEDFWIFIGSPEDNDSRAFQSDLIKYLEENDKELPLFDLSTADQESEEFEALFHNFGLDEEIPSAVYHISKGYIVKSYAVVDKTAVEDFRKDYKKRHNTMDNYIQEISVPEMKELYESGESFWSYMGRSSCPDCRAYYPRLVAYLEEAKEPIYYVVTDKNLLSEEDLAYMTDFREQYQIEEVPAIIHMENSEMIRHYDMQTPSDIEDFEKDFHDCCGFLN